MSNTNILSNQQQGAKPNSYGARNSSGQPNASSYGARNSSGHQNTSSYGAKGAGKRGLSEREKKHLEWKRKQREWKKRQERWKKINEANKRRQEQRRKSSDDRAVRRQRRFARSRYGQNLAMSKAESNSKLSKWIRITYPSILQRQCLQKPLDISTLKSKEQMCLELLQNVGKHSSQKQWLRQQLRSSPKGLSYRCGLDETLQEVCDSDVYVCKQKFSRDTLIRDLPIPFNGILYVISTRRNGVDRKEIELFPHLKESDSKASKKQRKKLYNDFINNAPTDDTSQSSQAIKDEILEQKTKDENERYKKEIKQLLSDFSVRRFRTLQPHMSSNDVSKAYVLMLDQINFVDDVGEIRFALILIGEILNYFQNDISSKTLKSKLFKVCARLGFGEAHSITSQKYGTFDTRNDLLMNVIQHLKLEDPDKYIEKYSSPERNIICGEQLNDFMWLNVIDYLPRSSNIVPEHYNYLQERFKSTGVRLNLLQCEMIEYIEKNRGTHNSLVVSAPTTTGKTLGYTICLCGLLVSNANKGKEYIIIVPTDALKEQIITEIDATIQRRYSDFAKVMLPQDFLQEYNTRTKLDEIGHIFFDEADSWMDEIIPSEDGTLEKYFGLAILEKIRCQWTMISATLPDLDNLVEALCEFETHKYGQDVEIKKISHNVRPVGLEWCKSAIVGYGEPENIDWTVKDAVLICNASMETVDQTNVFIDMPILKVGSSYQNGREAIALIKNQFCSFTEEQQLIIRDQIRKIELDGLDANDVIPSNTPEGQDELIHCILETYHNKEGEILIPYTSVKQSVKSFCALQNFFQTREIQTRQTSEFKKRERESEKAKAKQKLKQKEEDKGRKKSKKGRSADERDQQRLDLQSKVSENNSIHIEDLSGPLSECSIKAESKFRYVTEAVARLKSWDQSQFPDKSDTFPGRENLIDGLLRGFAYHAYSAWFVKDQIYPGLLVYFNLVRDLAHKGAVTVIFSDSSLIIGVNLHIGVVIFDGADDGHDLKGIRQGSGRAGRLRYHNKGIVKTVNGWTFNKLFHSLEGNLPAMMFITSVVERNEINRRKNINSEFMISNQCLREEIAATMIQKFFRNTKGLREVHDLVKKLLVVKIRLEESTKLQEELQRQKEEEEHRIQEAIRLERERIERERKEEAIRLERERKAEEERIKRERHEAIHEKCKEHFCSASHCAGKGTVQLKCNRCNGEGCNDRNCGSNGAPRGYYRINAIKCCTKNKCKSYNCNDGYAQLVCRTCNGKGENCSSRNCGSYGAPPGYYRVKCRDCHPQKTRNTQRGRNGYGRR